MMNDESSGFRLSAKSFIIYHSSFIIIRKMRKHKPKPRVLAPDPRYSDTMVTRFVNNLMWEGKKSVAFGIFYDALTS
jgi:hypothetical protein